MKFGFAIAAACFAIVAGTTQGMANQAGNASTPMVTTDVETGYVTTQGRRGGGFRAGGGRSFVRGGGRRHFGRNVAIGVGAAVLGGIIVNEAYRSRGGGGNCRSWSYSCSNGSGWACRQLDRYC